MRQINRNALANSSGLSLTQRVTALEGRPQGQGGVTRAEFDALKRQVAGDVITLGVDGDREQVLATVRDQAFVREASTEDELIRLYVDQGETAVPQILRILDGAGLAARSITLARPSLDDVFLRQTGRSLRDEAAA